MGLAGALALAVTWAAAPGAAADSLVVSEPRDRQELSSAPGWVTLAFDADIQPGSAKMLVQDSQGHSVTTGQLIVEGTNVTSQLADGLARGTYTVRYRVSESGEPFGGAYQFAYGSGSFTNLPDKKWSGTKNEPGALSNDDPNATTSAPKPTPEPKDTGPGVDVSKGPAAPPTSAPPSTTPTSGPSDTASPSPTAEPTATATSPAPSASPSAPAGGGSGPGTGVVVALVLAGLAVVGGVVTALVRARRRSAGSD